MNFSGSTARLLLAILVAIATGAGVANGHGRQVAITIDDLQRGGDGGPYDPASVRAMTEKLLRPFREQKIPVIGFVNAGRNVKNTVELQKVLNLWLGAGADLGNHSYSHIDINAVSWSKQLAGSQCAGRLRPPSPRGHCCSASSAYVRDLECRVQIV